MQRLIFVDDDQAEIEAFRRMIVADYECTTVQWPEESAKLARLPAPSLIVSELYLRPLDRAVAPTEDQRELVARAAKHVTEAFSSLLAEPSDDDGIRLQQMAGAVQAGNDLLNLQKATLSRFSEHGIALLAEMKARYPEVPVVFYSQNINAEDVIRSLQAGAADVICKGALKKDQLLIRLTAAQDGATLKSVKSQSSPKEEDPAQKKAESTVFERAKTIAASVKFLDPWLGVGTHAFGFGTAIVTFMLARSKLLGWIHGSGPPGISAKSSVIGNAQLYTLVILVSWLSHCILTTGYR
jgi:DNA-binding NarL/FixJ family response regulator